MIHRVNIQRIDYKINLYNIVAVKVIFTFRLVKFNNVYGL